MRNAFLIVWCAVYSVIGTAAYADDVPIDVVIVNTSVDTPMIKALSSITSEAIKEAFENGRQLVPYDAQTFLQITNTKSADEIVGKAHLYGVSLIVYMQVFLVGPVYTCNLTFKPLEAMSTFKEETITIHSTIPKNIPLKAAKEILKRHSDFLLVTIKQKINTNTYIIDAGQWHGLQQGRYTLTDGAECVVVSVKRYSALVTIHADYNEGQQITLNAGNKFPMIIKRIDAQIHENINQEYSGKKLLKGDSDGKRAIEATCVVNPLGNIVLPGYGAFLSTHYLGFSHSEPDWPGIYVALGAVATQLMLVPSLGNLDVNFFPWVNGNKTNAQYRLGIYLWATLPVTYTVAFFNQLSYAYQKQKVLPPFFLHDDVTAFVASAIVPGGGLFYKGHRLWGHTYWLTECSLGGLLTYYWEDGGKRAVFAGAFIGIKLIELIHAVIASPVYSMYTYELSNNENVHVDVGMAPFQNEPCFYAYFFKNY